MNKIPTLFVRDYSVEPPKLTRKVTPGCEWVLAGEGVAMEKFDGMPCLIYNLWFYKRLILEYGQQAPRHWIPADIRADEHNSWHGWVPIFPQEEKWYYEGLENTQEYYPEHKLEDGSYELVGPQINGNPYHFNKHMLLKHDGSPIESFPRDFDGIRAWLAQTRIEGVVWHHPYGKMAKIKRRDFGFAWPVPDCTQ